MSAAPVFFTSAGMVCAVGHTAAASCAAIRADLAGFQDLPYVDNEGETIRGAPVPGIPTSERASDRLTTMLAMSIGDCLAEAPWLRDAALPLLVGIAEPDRPGGLRLSSPAALLDDAGRSSGARLHGGLSRVFPAGHTAAFHALAAARELLSSGAAPACLVAGVDSYLNASSLAWLSAHLRLKTPNNSDGVIPGEAAGCVLVERAPRSGGDAVRLLGLGFGHEPASILTAEPPLQARGLVQASRAALEEAGIGLHDIDFRICDVAGEGYAFKEVVLAMQKLLRKRREAFPLWHPADAIGDTGAAAGVCQLVTAIQAIRKGYAPGSRVIGYCSAVAGDRAAAILDGR